MLKIEIIDPHSHSKEELIQIARLLMHIADIPMVAVPHGELESTKPLTVDRKEQVLMDDPRAVPLPDKLQERINHELPATVTPPPPPPAPPVIAAAPIPPAPVTAVPTPPASEVFKKTEEVWNPEIHARTKSKNPDGTYKLKRGSLKPGLVGEVIQVSPPSITLPPGKHTVNLSDGSFVSEPPPVVEDAFDTLMNEMLDLFAAQQIQPTDVMAFAKRHNVNSIPLLSEHPNLWPLLRAEINKLRGN